MAYYAVPGNTKAVRAFRDQATRHWHKALRRRSQKPGSTGRGCTGSRLGSCHPPARYIPSPARFDIEKDVQPADQRSGAAHPERRPPHDFRHPFVPRILSSPLTCADPARGEEGHAAPGSAAAPLTTRACCTLAGARSQSRRERGKGDSGSVGCSSGPRRHGGSDRRLPGGITLRSDIGRVCRAAHSSERSRPDDPSAAPAPGDWRGPSD